MNPEQARDKAREVEHDIEVSEQLGDGVFADTHIARALLEAQQQQAEEDAAAVLDAKSHLRCALIQSRASDDQIIIGHIRDALSGLERDKK